MIGCDQGVKTGCLFYSVASTAIHAWSSKFKLLPPSEASQ